MYEGSKVKTVAKTDVVENGVTKTYDVTITPRQNPQVDENPYVYTYTDAAGVKHEIAFDKVYSVVATEKQEGETINKNSDGTETITEKTGADLNGKQVKDAYKELTGLDMKTDPIDYSKNHNGDASVSLGVHSYAKEDLSMAIGAVALGTGAIADKQNAVAKQIAIGFQTDAAKVGSGSLSLSTQGIGQNAPTNKEITGNTTGAKVNIRPSDHVEMVVGNNLMLNQANVVTEVDSGKVDAFGNPIKTTKNQVNYAYSLNPELTNLTSANFTGTNGNTTTITGDGITLAPKSAAGNSPVSLTQNGLDNGGNAITNVAGNLPGAKKDSTAPTTSQAAPNTTNTNDANYVNPNNGATVGDVLNAGWNLQGNGAAVDFVKPYDTVNFVNGKGTTASVTKNATTGANDITFNINTATITNANGKAETTGTGNVFATATWMPSAVGVILADFVSPSFKSMPVNSGLVAVAKENLPDVWVITIFFPASKVTVSPALILSATSAVTPFPDAAAFQ